MLEVKNRCKSAEEKKQILCDAIRFMRHKVRAHKFRQITIISYLPVIQIKLYIFRQRNDSKNSAISTFEK